MFASGFGRGGKSEQFRFTDVFLKRNDIADVQTPVGQCAGLVKGDGVHLPHLFKGFAGLDNHAVLCRLADGRHNGGGRCQHQSAGAEHHQYGHGGNNISTEHIGKNCYEQSHRHQPARRSVGDPLHGSLLILRVLHHADELLQ